MREQNKNNTEWLKTMLLSVSNGCLLVTLLAPRYKKEQGKLRISKSVLCCHEYNVMDLKLTS
jgi:hypothetical protein